MSAASYEVPYEEDIPRIVPLEEALVLFTYEEKLAFWFLARAFFDEGAISKNSNTEENQTVSEKIDSGSYIRVDRPNDSEILYVNLLEFRNIPKPEQPVK